MTARHFKPIPGPPPPRPVALPSDNQARAFLAELRAAGYPGRALALSLEPLNALRATAYFHSILKDQREPFVSEILEQAHKLATAHYSAARHG